ncbi:MAG: hypothetical protein ABI165_03610 [Bryobacteraceae bacterium]
MFLVSPAGWQRLLLDADAALHLRIGEIILAAHSVPSQDLFSFSKPAGTWYAFEWLSEITYAWVFNLAGLKGVTLLAGVLIALSITVLLKYSVWKGADGVIALVLTMLAATALSIHFYARPHLFTLLLLAVAVWVLEYNRRQGGWLVWCLVPLTALWTNLHGGFFVFFALLALRATGCAGEAWFWPSIRRERRRETLQLVALGAACGIASLANPYGINLHRHILETLNSPWIMDNVLEFKSPSFRSEELLDFMILLFAGLACIAPLIQKRSLVEPLWIVFLAYCSLISVRHVTIFVLVATPVIAVELSEWWTGVTWSRPRTSLLGTLGDLSRAVSEKLPGASLFIPIAIIGLAFAPGLNWPVAFPEGAVPVRLIEPHLDLLASGRLFASDQIADYLIYRNYPRQKVFLDSRHNYYGEAIGNDYLAINKGGPEWRRLFDRYGFTLILCNADAPLAALVEEAGGWRVVDRDAKYILFERGTGG